MPGFFSIQNGFLSALPYLCWCLFSILVGYLSDNLIATGTLTTTQARKTFQGIGQFGPALGLMWLAFVGCNPATAVMALCFAVGLNGAVFSGFQVSQTFEISKLVKTLHC